jgi:hypothetical protein
MSQEKPDLAPERNTSKVKPLTPKEIVGRLDSSNRQKFLFEYEKRARDQSTKWQSVWEAHLLVLTILREIASIPTLSPYPFVAVCRWEPAKEMILGEGEGEFKLVLCDEVGAHFCVVSSRIVNAEFYTEKNRQIYADLQREILHARVCHYGAITDDQVESNRVAFMQKYPWAASRTIAVAVSDEHPFIAEAYRSARKHHLVFRQRQFHAAYREQFEKTRRAILKKGIEMTDRNAISLRINAAISPHPFTEKSKGRLSHGGVKRWIEGIDDNPVWEEDEYKAGQTIYDPAMNQSITALQVRF